MRASRPAPRGTFPIATLAMRLLCASAYLFVIIVISADLKAAVAQEEQQEQEQRPPPHIPAPDRFHNGSIILDGDRTHISASARGAAAFALPLVADDDAGANAGARLFPTRAAVVAAADAAAAALLGSAPFAEDGNPLTGITTLLFVFAAGVLLGTALSRRSAPRLRGAGAGGSAAAGATPAEQSPFHTSDETVSYNSAVNEVEGSGGGSVVGADATELSPPPPPRDARSGAAALVAASGGGGASTASVVPPPTPPRDTGSLASAASDDASSAESSDAADTAAAAAAVGAALTAADADAIAAAAAISRPVHLWYITQQDLDFFRLRAEQDVVVHGAGPWSHMVDREVPHNYRYSAWRRTLANGLTEYRSVMVMPDCSPLEYVDFSFDDAVRCRWEGFMVSAEVLEAGDQRQRQQVVRWIRSFPFGFITDRQYVIARALFSVTPDGVVHAGLPAAAPPAARHGPAAAATPADAVPAATFYCVTKAIDHPGANDGTTGRIVQVTDYYSMWRVRSVACPWGGERPAVELMLLHCEDMKVPERLARMSVGLGMRKYVHIQVGHLPGFVTERRSRVAPTQPDPLAYGHHHHVYGPAATARAAAAAARSGAAGSGEGAADRRPPHGPSTPLAPTRAAAAASGRGGGGGGQYDSSGPEGVLGGGESPAGVGSDAAASDSDGGGGGEWRAATDPWVSVGRGTSSTGPWSRQALPQALTSSSWGPDQAGRRGGGGGGAGRLLRRAALAAVVVLVARHWRRGGPDGGAKRAWSTGGGKRGGRAEGGDGGAAAALVGGEGTTADIDAAAAGGEVPAGATGVPPSP
ncbi:hypothetical protein PLESTB_001570400 [Pleodorina starrii]|uniref:START domain-containing protein n=1 Tax=Pleodorina starrii TaxID=330485 RepID=A0A9W6F8B5_9CHLO|nr:hypothetical protein PLESTB_001570400 [Pleodorina starrii]GLC72700.1 hypothetical protein PLESTF_001283700 [Pleodorina starrii]